MRGESKSWMCFNKVQVTAKTHRKKIPWCAYRTKWQSVGKSAMDNELDSQGQRGHQACRREVARLWRSFWELNGLLLYFEQRSSQMGLFSFITLAILFREWSVRKRDKGGNYYDNPHETWRLYGPSWRWWESQLPDIFETMLTDQLWFERL